jgi:hypothetical protein
MVFEFIKKKLSEAAYMFFLDQCSADHDSRVISSPLTLAIRIAQGENIAFLVVWADDEKTETFLRRMFPIRRTSQHFRFIRLPDAAKIDEIGQDLITVCPTMIYPPQ